MDKKKDVPVCLVITNMGRILVNYEVDSVHFHYGPLGLLLATLFQFSGGQNYSQVEINNYTIVLCSDKCTQISTALICCRGEAAKYAKLKGSVILRAFLTHFEKDLERIIEGNKADVEEMTHSYTLTNALGGLQVDDTTDTAFISFQNDFIAQILDKNENEILESIPWQPESDSQHDVQITQGFLMNGQSGEILYTKCSRQSHFKVEETTFVQQLIKHVASGFEEAYPLLNCSSQLILGSVRTHNLSSQSSSKCSALFLRIKSNISKQPFYIGLRMFPIGTFLSVIFFHGKNEYFQPFTKDEANYLERVLISDLRGGRLLHILQQASGPDGRFELHFGSDGASKRILSMLDAFFLPWMSHTEMENAAAWKPLASSPSKVSLTSSYHPTLVQEARTDTPKEKKGSARDAEKSKNNR